MHHAIRVLRVAFGGRRAILLAAVILPGFCAADGLIVIDDPPPAVAGHFSFAPLEVSYHRVTVAVADLVAVTTVDEEFYNANGWKGPTSSRCRRGRISTDSPWTSAGK